MLRKSINDVSVIGYLAEADLNEKVSKKDNKEFIGGKIIVRVPGNAEYEDRDIPINVFAYKTITDKKTGTLKENPNYKYLKGLMETEHSIAALGSALYADKISVNGTLSEGFYQNNYFVQIRGSFIGPAKGGIEGATFDTEIMVKSIADEIVNDIPTGRLLVEGIIVQWNMIPDVIKFVVDKPDAINYIKSFWNIGSTVRATGDIVFREESTEVENNVNFAFGRPTKKVYTKTIRDCIIKSGSEPYYDNLLDPSEVTQALALKREQEKNNNDVTDNKTNVNSRRGF